MAVLEVQTENSMQEIINTLEDKVKNIENTAYSGEYRSGYVDAFKDAVEILEKNLHNLMYVGGIYYVITYTDGNYDLPNIEEMRLARIFVSGNRTTYVFIRDLKTMSFSIAKADISIGSRTTLYNRVFLSRESAEKYLVRGKTRRITK